MLDGPDIARVAALIGDPARSNMLCALLDGRALTASELAAVGGVSKQTASAHLGRLAGAGLLALEAQGRHRYFRLADDDVARALEALMGVAQRGVGRRVRTGPRELEMRRARTCYDHLAGEAAVALFDRLVQQSVIAHAGEPGSTQLVLTDAGRARLTAIGVDLAAVETARRPVCRACLDWSVRRHHLAGGLGAALLAFALKQGWARKRKGSRAIRFAPGGEDAVLAIAG